MIKTKGCKRCGGDLCVEQDGYGAYLSCIQCGAEYQTPQDMSACGQVGATGEQKGEIAVESQPLIAISR